MKRKDKSKRKLFFIWSIVSLIIISIFLNNCLVVKASITNPINDEEDYQKALQTAPKGLHWDDQNSVGGTNNAFVKADFSEAAKGRGQSIPTSDMLNGHQHSLVNNAKIIQSPTDKNTSIIQMTNKAGQTGAVWSNDVADNYFDINHEQIASMWIYLGHVYREADYQTAYPGDGMAFVLHNDENKKNAIALYEGYPVNGQSLGVWGADWVHNRTVRPSDLAKSAIHNSWALEFDTFVNYSTANSEGEGVFFDGGLPDGGAYRFQRHIAGNYPGLASTYDNQGSYFSMNHGTNYKILKNLVNSQWRHITIKWTPKDPAQKTGTLSYAYNDKDPKTYLANTSSVVREKFDVDGKLLGLKNDDTKLYWGFTGSTGSNFENNLLIFESIPSYVDAESKADIYDDTKGGAPVTEGSTVDANDDIRYTYSLDYKGWAKNWAKIQASMGVPDNIKFTSGTIQYPESQTNSNSQPLPKEIFSDPNAKKINYELSDTLDKDNRKAIITLKGQAINKTSSILTVPEVYSSFEGDHLITGTQTNSFKINSKLFQLTSDSTDPIVVNSNEDVTIPGHVSYSNSSINPDYNSMVIHQKLNSVDTIPDVKVDSMGNFNLIINHSLLKDINQLSFYVLDSEGNQTNIINRQIDVKGLLQFGFITQNVFFKSINSTGKYSINSKPFPQPQIIQRSGNWSVNIVDNRVKGKNWVVRAQAKPLRSNLDGSNFDGKIIFKNNDGHISDLSNITDIASGTKTTDDTQTSDIAKPWSSNTGILLAMTGNNPEGKYTSQITWTIPDSIVNS